MAGQVHKELYCFSDDASEAVGRDVMAAGDFLHTRNIVIGICDRCFFF